MTKRAMKSAPKKASQTFAFNSPGALSVQLVADFTHWEKSPISLKRDRDGVWRTAVELAPGTYHYRFLVDGQWRDDPECTLRVPNPYGGSNAVRKVG
jgi:1,4-alpha-glucan branching enzyme